LTVIVVVVVEKYLGVIDAVFGGDGGVIDLRDADVEDSVTGADDERVGFADGVSESGTGGEIVRMKGTLPEGGNNGLDEVPRW